MSDTAVRIHLERLVAMEYVRPVAGRSGQRFEYELLFDGDLERSAPQMIGLIDISALGSTITTSQGQTHDPAPRSQAACTPVAPALQTVMLAEKPKEESSLPDPLGVGSGKALPGRVSLDGRSRSADLAPAPLSSSLAAVFSSSGR